MFFYQGKRFKAYTSPKDGYFAADGFVTAEQISLGWIVIMVWRVAKSGWELPGETHFQNSLEPELW